MKILFLVVILSLLFAFNLNSKVHFWATDYDQDYYVQNNIYEKFQKSNINNMVGKHAILGDLEDVNNFDDIILIDYIETLNGSVVCVTFIQVKVENNVKELMYKHSFTSIKEGMQDHRDLQIEILFNNIYNYLDYE